MISKKILKIPIINKFIFFFLEMQDSLDTLHSRIDVSDELFNKFQNDRRSERYLEVFKKKEPLVSVCIATYNRAELLVDRCLNSIFAQDYDNFEVIVVGDCCSDNSEKLIKQIGDERLHFHNLPERGNYPADPDRCWMVAGTTPINKALEFSQGDFITHLDDDDEYMPDRISKLVQFTQQKKLDFIWHPFWHELPNGKWKLITSHHFRKTEVTTSSSFYHKWLKIIPWDINAYKYNEPGDWNRFRKLKYIGLKMARFPKPLLKHYKERNQHSL
ncbi:MAG: glycosyltransferase family 2 protein [Nitrospinales bacterium]